MENITFLELPIAPEIQQAVTEMGFTTPSPIQAQAIPQLLAGNDVIGQAQTGTGKTAAFAIPALMACQANHYHPQVLVLCPTRELANQVAVEFKKIGKYLKGIHTTAIYGGESYERQIQALRRGVHIVIGTPGRVIDHIERGTLDLSHIRQIILDEADEMLNMGFVEDIERVLALLPENRQTIFFSATMPKPILDLTHRYQRNPQIVRVLAQQLTNQTIEQLYFPVKQEHKTELLTRLMEIHDLRSLVVFCNTKQQTDELVNNLQSLGLTAEALHGDLRQSQRTQVMARFRNGSLGILVATDVAARGIDVENVEAVINYDLPFDPEYYVHRIGRTGRAGRSGKSFTFVTPRDRSRLRQIEQYSKITIPKGQIPSKTEIWAARQTRFADKIKANIRHENLEQFKGVLEQFAQEGYAIADITAALMYMQLGEVPVPTREDLMEQQEAPAKYGKAGNNRQERERGSYGNRERQQHNGRMVRLFMNLGKNQKVSKGDILGAITGEAGISGAHIGTIDIYEKYSFVDIAQAQAQKVVSTMNRSTIKGKRVNIEYAQAD